MIHKNITVREDQSAWLDDNHKNLSRFIQSKIDVEMEKDGKL